MSIVCGRILNTKQLQGFAMRNRREYQIIPKILTSISPAEVSPHVAVIMSCKRRNAEMYTLQRVDSTQYLHLRLFKNIKISKAPALNLEWKHKFLALFHSLLDLNVTRTRNGEVNLHTHTRGFLEVLPFGFWQKILAETSQLLVNI